MRATTAVALAFAAPLAAKGLAALGVPMPTLPGFGGEGVELRGMIDWLLAQHTLLLADSRKAIDAGDRRRAALALASAHAYLRTARHILGRMGKPARRALSPRVAEAQRVSNAAGSAFRRLAPLGGVKAARGTKPRPARRPAPVPAAVDPADSSGDIEAPG